MKAKGFVLLITTAAAIAAVWPAAGSAGTFRGIVVARQHGSLFVASPAGVIRSVAGSAALGARVSLGGGRAVVVGHARRAVIRGIVVRRIGTTLILSSNRHLVAIHRARVLADTTPAPTTTAPAPGSVVSTTVGIANGELDEETEDDVGRVGASSIQVQAVVAAVGTGTVTLTVQGQTLTVPLPAGLTLPASVVGQTVTLSLSLAATGDDQGDDDGGDHHGGGGGGDG